MVGPNGCGKSTLLRVLAGADTALDSGEVQLRKGTRVGFLPQEPQFPENLTALDASPPTRSPLRPAAEVDSATCSSHLNLIAVPHPEPHHSHVSLYTPQTLSTCHRAPCVREQALLSTDSPTLRALKIYQDAIAASEAAPGDDTLALALADAAHEMDAAQAWGTEAAVDIAMDQLTVRPFAARSCGALSGGQTKRLALASVLLQARNRSGTNRL